MDCMRGANHKDYVESASFIFLNKYERLNGCKASGVLYNKFMTLLNRRFLSDDVDIGLPHCWYRWGDEVVRHGLDYLSWNHDDPRYTAVIYKGGIAGAYDPNDPLVREIESFAEEFIAMYKGPEGAEMAIDEVYADAPFQFQNDYRRLRESLRISRSHVGYDNFESYILSLFDTAMESFPREFRDLEEQRSEFEAVFRMAVSGGVSRDDLFELVEHFWFFFCYHLRINKKCHANVDRTTLEIWKDAVPLEDSRFEHGIRTLAYRLCPREYSDPRIDRMLHERELAIIEVERMLDYLNDGD